jgi:hypothetical protein
VIYPWPQQLPNLSRPSRAETVWAEWAEKNRVDFINLFRDFARLGSPDEIRRDYYLRNDWHRNARGNALVAGLLLDSYGALILPPPRGPQKTAGSAP